MVYGVIIPNFDEQGSVITVSKWHKSIGESVNRGDVLVEVDSCSSTCEILAPASGTLETIFIPDGGESRIGSQIGLINSTEEASYVTRPSKRIENIKDDATEAFSSEEFSKQEKEQKQEAIEQAEQNIINAQAEIDAEIAFAGEIVDKEPEKVIYENAKIIKEETGDGIGQILHNVEAMNEANELAKHEVNDRPETDPKTWNKVTKIPSPDEEIKELNEIEYNIARRRTLAAHNAVISTVINEIDMTNIIATARLFGDEFFKKHHVHLGYTAFILKAVVKALNDFPMLNAYMLDDKEITYRNNHDISIIMHGVDSVASPVIRNVDCLSINELQSYVIKLSERAKNNELTLEETSGATFTVINAGIYGSLLGSDIVTHPQIASLTMHKVNNRPIVNEVGDIVARPMMYISLSFDHRIANSKSASLFLEKVKTLSENLSWIVLGI